MAPGDPELDRAAERAQSGIPVDAVTWRAFAELAEKWNLAPPAPLAPTTQGRDR
jgi:LDH2 family malate/lactate/ureidoglycolate dehydrogenase